MAYYVVVASTGPRWQASRGRHEDIGGTSHNCGEVPVLVPVVLWASQCLRVRKHRVGPKGKVGERHTLKPRLAVNGAGDCVLFALQHSGALAACRKVSRKRTNRNLGTMGAPVFR